MVLLPYRRWKVPQPMMGKWGVSARYNPPFSGNLLSLGKLIPSFWRPLPSNGYVRIPPPMAQPPISPRRTWQPGELIPKEVERLEGYVRAIEDNWAAVTLKTVQGHRLEVWFPLARLQRGGLAYPGAAFQYIVKTLWRIGRDPRSSHSRSQTMRRGWSRCGNLMYPPLRTIGQNSPLPTVSWEANRPFVPSRLKRWARG